MRLHFAGFTLDADLFELRRGERVIEVQPKVLGLIRLLAENPSRALSKDEILDTLWPGVTVGEGSLARVASLARDALGAEAIRTVRGVGYRMGVPVEVEAAAGVLPPPPQAGALEQEIQFCRTADGAEVAWASVGEGTGVPLVRAVGWFTNLEREWQWPAGRRFWERLALGRRLVRYDGRGIGLSGPAEKFSAETRLRDLEAVVDAAGLERFALMGLSEGAATALRFAVRHPERVSHLVLYGPADLTVGDATPEMRERYRTERSMIKRGWGVDTPLYRQFFANLFLGPNADAEMVRYFGEMQRASASAETAARFYTALGDMDVRQEAPRVSVPTLVVHRRDDLVCSFEAGRKLAALVPGARFLPLDGENHWLLLEDQGAAAYAQALEAFLSRT